MAPIETRTTQTQTVLRCDQQHSAGPLAYYGEPGDSPVTTKAKARSAGWHVATINLYENGVRTEKTIDKVLCPRHARERAKCGHEPRHLVWKAQDGEVTICKMGDEHLVNALKFLVDNGRTDEDAYRQMYNEKQQREVVLRANDCFPENKETPIAQRLAVLNSYNAPVPPVKPSPVLPQPGERVVGVGGVGLSPDRIFTSTMRDLQMHTYDLVKELKDGEHVVVSRKADKGMVLNLDEDTVRALYTVLRHIGGSPDSPRRFTQAVLDAITEAIPQSEWLQPWVVFPGTDDGVEGNIHFLNGKRLAEKRKREQIRAASRIGPVGGASAALSGEPDDATPDFYVDGLEWLD